MKKTAKQIFKEEFKKTWDWYKWGIYIGLTGLLLTIIYDYVGRF